VNNSRARAEDNSYQFKKKAHEIQFTFNSGTEESVTAAKNELSKIASTDDQDKEAIKKAEMLLDEGLKSLEKCQKHIKVADRSGLSGQRSSTLTVTR